MQVDEFGTAQALQLNAELEFVRNKERYAFLRWGQTAFKNFAIVPPDTGIVHQINLEYLARVVFVGANGESGKPLAYPDTLVGTDSHTTMINGLGVLGWGVGGIEAEAAMLGQPVSMLIPQVVGLRLTQQSAQGSTATDLVLTVTEMLRKNGVVGKFVEFFGPGLHRPAAGRSRHHRQHGSRVRRDLRHLPRRRGDAALPAPQRPPRRAGRAGRGLLQGAGTVPHRDTPEAEYTRHAASSISPPSSPASPGRSVRRIACRCRRAAESFEQALPSLLKPGQQVPPKQGARWEAEGGTPPAWTRSRTASRSTSQLDKALNHGSVVIAAITSCTNTSNPSVLVGRRTARQEGGREGPDRSGVGENVARAGLAGRHRIPRRAPA